MKVGIPAALKKLGTGPIRTREDAIAAAQQTCQFGVHTCTTAPASEDCQEVLATVGLGDPNYSPSAGASLYKAAASGATSTVSKLLANGTDPNWRDARGWTPLMIAAAERHLDTVVVLLEAKADPNARNALGRTALMFASGYGQDAIVERLLAAGADPNIVPKAEEWTALVAAAARGHTRVAELLLRGGADPTIRTKDGRTALDLARSEGHAEVVRVLQAAGKGN